MKWLWLCGNSFRTASLFSERFTGILRGRPLPAGGSVSQPRAPTDGRPYRFDSESRLLSRTPNFLSVA